MQVLRAKSILVLLVVVLSLMHDFWLGPKVLERLEQARAAGQVLPPESDLKTRPHDRRNKPAIRRDHPNLGCVVDSALGLQLQQAAGVHKGGDYLGAVFPDYD